MEVQVFYQDERLAVVCKPCGVLSEENDNRPNMPALLREQLCCETVYPVHRLDRTTQGVMAYAKTEEAARRLSRLIQDGGMEKTYLAVTEGIPPQSAGELCDLLYFDRKKNKSYVVKRERRGVKRALLRYETIGTAERDGKPLALLRIRLLTGRTHQIRVQFASRKMPLVGDRRYGSSVMCGDIALCSHQLRFIHPFTGEEMNFIHQPTDGAFALFDQNEYR